MAGLASALTKAVRGKTRLDQFRADLDTLGQPTAMPKPLPMPADLQPTPGPAVITNVAAPYGRQPTALPAMQPYTAMSPQQRMGGSQGGLQDRLMGALGRMSAKGGKTNALASGMGPFNWLRR